MGRLGALFRLCRAKEIARFGLSLSLTGALTGCTVTLLSAYDSGTDQMTSALQRSVALHVETLAAQQPPACFYDNYQAFYAQERADVGALEVRVNAIAKNGPTIGQVAALKSALAASEALHKSATTNGRCQSAAELQPELSGLNMIFGAILKLEIAKQRGKQPGT